MNFLKILAVLEILVFSAYSNKNELPFTKCVQKDYIKMETEKTIYYPMEIPAEIISLSFKPEMFWSQSRKYQLLYLKDVILDLIDVVAKYADHYSYAFAPFKLSVLFEEKYPSDIEEQFEEAVWNKLKGFTKEKGLPDLSFEDFKQSLTATLFYSGLCDDQIDKYAPLIYYFENSLAPRFEIHYQQAEVPAVDLSGIIIDHTNKTIYRFDPPFCSSTDSQPALQLTKVIQLPSEFEELIGIGKEPKLVYEKGMTFEEVWGNTSC